MAINKPIKPCAKWPEYEQRREDKPTSVVAYNIRILNYRREGKKLGIKLVGFNYKDEPADAKRWLAQFGDPYDVIIADRQLPYLDGLTVITALRERSDRTPVLILSALGTADDRVHGLKAGGYDYLTKPFAFAELLARI